MNYRSICTGIAAETVAWHELGWKPLTFAEIDPFCCALLKHHYPTVKNHGDFTQQKEDGIETDVLIGGTPCQSFSVAGKRAGLDDPRGNLALEFIRLAQRLRPRWIIWENVKGVLSSWSYDAGANNETNDFDTFLAALAECGYGFAYRVLDAQYDGLAQRRQRVFVVGYLGDWRPPAAVLFERESLRRDLAPGRKAGQEVAGTLGARTKGGGGFGTNLEVGGGLQTVSMALNAHGGAGRLDGESETFIVAPLTSANHYGDQDARESQLVVGFHGAQITSKENRSQPSDISPTLNEDPRLMIAHILSADGFDASEDGTGRGSPLVVSAFLPGQGSKGRGIGYADEQSPTLRSGDGSAKNIGICFDSKQSGNDAGELAPTLRAMGHKDSHANGGGGIATTIGQAVRRLTPMEWERLMGFSDGYSLIPYPTHSKRTGKPLKRVRMAVDGPRYKAIGNSISVPTLRWIGKRIQTVDEIIAGSRIHEPKPRPVTAVPKTLFFDSTPRFD